MAVLYLAHGYGFNHYYDVILGERPLPPSLAEGFSLRAGLWVSIVLLVAAVGLALLLSPLAAAMVVAGGAVSLAYSASVPRLKNNSILNPLLNAVGFGLLFLVGFFANKGYQPNAAILFGFIALGVIPAQILHLMSHMPGERHWQLSLGTSVSLFYVSHGIWLGYAALTALLWYRAMVVLVAVTMLYSLSQLVITVTTARGWVPTVAAATIIRRRLRPVHVVFGTVLVVLFCWPSPAVPTAPPEATVPHHLEAAPMSR